MKHETSNKPTDQLSQLGLYNIDGRCSVVRCETLSKYQRNILHPKMYKIARNFSATFPNFLRNFCHKVSTTFGFFERNFLRGLKNETTREVTDRQTDITHAGYNYNLFRVILQQQHNNAPFNEHKYNMYSPCYRGNCQRRELHRVTKRYSIGTVQQPVIELAYISDTSITPQTM